MKRWANLDDASPTLRAVSVVAVTAGVTLLHLLFFRPFFTAQISDEISYLVSAKYLFTDLDLGYAGWAMKGYSLFLRLLAVPFGGLDQFSPKGAHDLAWIANTIISSAFVPLVYAFLRDFRIDFPHALLGSITTASLPFFYIYSPLAMTEIFFALLCMLYVFAVLRFFDRDLYTGVPYLLATLALTAALTATKAPATYYVAATCLLAVLLYRTNARTISLIVLSVITVLLVRQTRMMFGYNVDLSLSRIFAHFGAIFFGITASLCVSLIYFAPMLDTAAPRMFAGSWRSPAGHDESGEPSRRATNALIFAAAGLLLPAVGISSLFHGLIDRLTNYRTVASVIPVFLAATLAFALAPRPQDSQIGARPFRVRFAAVRLVLIIMLFAAIFALKAFGRYFFADNFFDFVTVLPLYGYLNQPLWSKPALWLLGFMAAFALVALLPRPAVRMTGLIAINIALLAYYHLTSPWSTDKNIATYYAGNLRMYEAMKDVPPKSFKLLDIPPDVQWLHFGYPYLWNNVATTKMIMVAPGNEAMAGPGIGLVRAPVINAEILHKEEAERQTFLSYDLNAPRVRGMQRTAIDELRARGNTAYLNPTERFGEQPFAYASPDAMFGPFILPAGQTTRVTLWSPPVAAEAQYKGCALATNTARWPLNVHSSPSAQANEWALIADVMPDETLFGMLRLTCPVTVERANGGFVTLPLSGLSITQLSEQPKSN